MLSNVGWRTEPRVSLFLLFIPQRFAVGVVELEQQDPIQLCGNIFRSPPCLPSDAATPHEVVGPQHRLGDTSRKPSNRPEGWITGVIDDWPASRNRLDPACRQVASKPLFHSDIDYAQLHKIYATPNAFDDERRYSPAVCTRIDVRKVNGNPDLDKDSTSCLERQNLTMRMGVRRFARLTYGFSKKVENLAHAVSLHYVYYNFARPHTTLSKDVGGRLTTPAMTAGIENCVWTVRDIAALLD